MRRTLRTLFAVLMICGVAAVSALAATTKVKVGDNFFVKQGGGTVTVKKGTKVTWTFTGKAAHIVTGTGAAKFINSGSPKSKGTYSVIAKKTGTFKIICTIHSGQRMTLKVK